MVKPRRAASPVSDPDVFYAGPAWMTHAPRPTRLGLTARYILSGEVHSSRLKAILRRGFAGRKELERGPQRHSTV